MNFSIPQTPGNYHRVQIRLGNDPQIAQDMYPVWTGPSLQESGALSALPTLRAFTCASFSRVTADCSRIPHLLHTPSYLIVTCHESSLLSNALWCVQDGVRGQVELTRTQVASCDKSTLGSLHQQRGAQRVCASTRGPLRSAEFFFSRNGINGVTDRCEKVAVEFEACCVSGPLHSLLLVMDMGTHCIHSLRV